MLLFVADEDATSFSLKTGSTLDALESLVPGIQKTIIAGAGVTFMGVQDDNKSNYGFSYTDDNIISLSGTTTDSQTFNSVRIIYYDSGWKYTTISDAVDVALRGNVYYPRLIGGYTLAKSTQLANQLIQFSLSRDIRAEIACNPYLEPGQVIKITSTKYGIPASYATITDLNHQYQVGRAITYLNGIKLVAI